MKEPGTPAQLRDALIASGDYDESCESVQLTLKEARASRMLLLARLRPSAPTSLRPRPNAAVCDEACLMRYLRARSMDVT